MLKVKDNKYILKRHIIIGGNGFLGSEIVKYLFKKKVKDILIVDINENIKLKNIRYLKCDISRKEE